MKASQRTLVGSDGSLLGIGEKLSVLEGLGRVSNETRNVYDLWSNARVGPGLPSLADVPFDQLGDLKDTAVVLALIPGAHDYLYLECGALEVRIRGGDPRGRTLRQCHEGDILAFVLDSYDRAAKSGEGIIDFSVDIAGDQRYVTTEVIFLPLADDHQHVSHILAYCHYRDTGRPPV